MLNELHFQKEIDSHIHDEIPGNRNKKLTH